MTDWKALDRWAIEEAVRLAASQPRCDYTIPELPQLASAITSDILPIWRNGQTYGVPVSGLPSGGGGGGIATFFNVKSYGATGNGTTDDTAAIQATIAAAAAAGGGIVYFPNGNYLVSSTLTISVAGITLMGSGWNATYITSKGGVTPAPTVVAVSANFVNIRDISFYGNGLAAAPPPVAPEVIALNGCGAVIIEGCYFYNNKGPTIYCHSATDVEVRSCDFQQVGYLAGFVSASRWTPAVYVDAASTAVKVHHNYFQNCYYIGVQVLGSFCDVSFNHFTQCYGSSISFGSNTIGQGNDGRIVGNIVDHSRNEQPATADQGIYVQGVSNVICAYNVVRYGDAAGIAGGARVGCVFIGNVCYNNSQVSTNKSGIQDIQQAAQPGFNNVFMGNACYDNQGGSATQGYGLEFLSSDGTVGKYYIVVGNTVGNGNTLAGIHHDGTGLGDNTNVFVGNGWWYDRLNSQATQTLTGTVAKSTLESITVREGSMLINNGIHVVAAGKQTGATANSTYYFGFGGSGNLLSHVADSTGTKDWLLEADIFNINSAANSQSCSVRFYFGGALVAQIQTHLSISTLSDVVVLMEAAVPGAGDTVLCDFMNILRV